MVDTGNVEQDVVQMDRSDIIRLEKEGDYWEEIDYSLFDVENIDEGQPYKYSVDMLPYGTVIGYRNDVFPEGPSGQADFWNQDAFPGPRTTAGGTGGVTPYLESASSPTACPRTRSTRSTSTEPTPRSPAQAERPQVLGSGRSRRRC